MRTLYRRKTLVPGGGKGESQLSVLSEAAQIVGGKCFQHNRKRRKGDGNILGIKYTRNACTDGFSNVQGERALVVTIFRALTV